MNDLSSTFVIHDVQLRLPKWGDQMRAGAKIFERVMQKRIGNAEYWRRIEIVEEGPFVFRVVQDHELNQLEGDGKPETVAGRSEWMCPTQGAATEQALRCLHQSKNDEWVFSTSASSSPSV